MIGKSRRERKLKVRLEFVKSRLGERGGILSRGSHVRARGNHARLLRTGMQGVHRKKNERFDQEIILRLYRL